jgi:membrane-associated phospholipid phosphatase
MSANSNYLWVKIRHTLVATLLPALLGQFITVQSLFAQNDTLRDKRYVQYDTVIYLRPQWHSPISTLPKTFSMSARTSFSKRSIPAWGAVTASTLLFYAVDQKMLAGVQQFSNTIGIDAERKYRDIIVFHLGKTKIPVYQAPENLNTALYSVGEGFTSVMICAGLLTHGLVKHNTRSLSTASQIMQAQLAVGVTAQLIKRITGRESPFEATTPRGEWRPFTSPATYQKHVPMYDAFPSGHMASMVATLTVLAGNYPEKKWIKPIGYAITAVVGLAMMNNGVHWISDYPLAIGMGYVYGITAVRMNRWVKGSPH